jgi:hypothetical protein
MSLKEEGREDKVEDLSSHWIALKGKRKYWKLKDDTLDHTF